MSSAQYVALPAIWGDLHAGVSGLQWTVAAYTVVLASLLMFSGSTADRFAGLVRRRPHPTDRRAKLVETMRRGKDLARRADAILAHPAAALSTLDEDDLDALRQALLKISGG